MPNPSLTQSVAQLNAAIVAQAIAEPEFRAKLLADPKGTVEKALGAPLPEELTLKVVEATPSEYTIVLPYEAKAVADGELSDADLESVAGGRAKMSIPRETWHGSSAGHVGDHCYTTHPVVFGNAIG